MTEAVFAREEVKEFPDEYALAIFAAIYEVFSWFAENFLVRNGPCDRRYGRGQQKQNSDVHCGNVHA